MVENGAGWPICLVLDRATLVPWRRNPPPGRAELERVERLLERSWRSQDGMDALPRTQPKRRGGAARHSTAAYIHAYMHTHIRTYSNHPCVHTFIFCWMRITCVGSDQIRRAASEAPSPFGMHVCLGMYCAGLYVCTSVSSAQLHRQKVSSPQETKQASRATLVSPVLCPPPVLDPAKQRGKVLFPPPPCTPLSHGRRSQKPPAPGQSARIVCKSQRRRTPRSGDRNCSASLR
jgi:hypothetical protein